MKNEKTRVRRLPKRGFYDKETIYGILDGNYLCHVAFQHEDYPVIIPTAYGRLNDDIYIHGSSASRMQKDLAQGIKCCICVSKINDLVLAKSGFHHSMNYESVVIFGIAEMVDDRTEKISALKVISDSILESRWEESRFPSEIELKATTVLKIPIVEASAKIRTGMPSDDPIDDDLKIWSGLIPLEFKYGEAVPVDPNIEIPPSVLNAKLK